jgi:hypothetical protein
MVYSDDRGGVFKTKGASFVPIEYFIFKILYDLPNTDYFCKMIISQKIIDYTKTKLLFANQSDEFAE